jgi:hypothetical protein
MTVYSYLIEHDLGLAPNPFGQYCTLAVCKPSIRMSSNLKIGDWVIGTGSKALEGVTKRKLTNKLIYAMEIKEKLTLDEYWNEPRFQYKKPVMNGSLISMYGDNFYHMVDDCNWIQEDSAHSNIDASCNVGHLKKDTGGKNVLISDNFFYFGDKAPVIPDFLLGICYDRQGHKIVRPPQLASDTIDWVKSSFKKGIHGNPISWMISPQLKLF